jgi:hypothetical protein
MWEYNGGGEFVQSTLYAFMELPVLLRYANSKLKLKQQNKTTVINISSFMSYYQD